MADQPLWNPSDKDGDVSLSNGNRTWQQASGTVGCVRSTVGLSAGKWRIQLTQITANGSACRHGFATAAHSIASPPGASASSWAINGQGSLEHDGSTGADYPNFANGAVVQLYVDIDAGKIWYGDAGGPYAGNPAAGTGAMHSFTPGTTLHLAGGMDGGGSLRGATLRLLADYGGSPPTGFTDGWGSGALGFEAAAGAGAVAGSGRSPLLRVGNGLSAESGSGALVATGRAVELAAGEGMLSRASPSACHAAGHVAALRLGNRLVSGPMSLAVSGAAVRGEAPVGHSGAVGAARLTLFRSWATVVAGAPVRPTLPPPGDLAALLAPTTGELDWVAVAEPWDAEIGETVSLRWATRDFTTAPAADPPNMRIPGRLVDCELQAALWADRALFGRSGPATGSLVIENADGALDHLGSATTTAGGRRWHFRRRAVRILVGHPSWPWNEYRRVFTGEIEQESFSDGRLTLQLRDRLRRLDQPLQPAVFRGDRVLLQSASAVPVALGTRTFALPDLIENGQFASSLTGWDAGSGWSFDAGRAAKAAGAASGLAQSVASAPDAAYRIRFDVTRAAGTLQLIVDGEPVGEPIAASGSFRPSLVARRTAMRIEFRADAAFAGTLDAVTVRQDPAAEAGDAVRIARTGDLLGTWMAGAVLSWSESTGELAVDVGEAVGAGVHDDWSIWLRPGAGPPEAAGKNLPVAFGTVRHAEPVDLGSVQGLWLRRIADTAVRIEDDAGHGIHDGGVPLDLAESFPPAAGEGFLDAAEGLVWLASRPQYPLTISFEAGAGGATSGRTFARPGHHLFRVPPGVTALRAKLWGGGGGHGGPGDGGQPGGGGGFVDATIAVTPGEVLRVSVPDGGAAGVSGGGGGAAGAAVAGGDGGAGSSRTGGGGAGAAGLSRAGTLLLLAPGGGGGSGEAAGGAGGGASGSVGGDGGSRHGAGGTSVTGGSGGAGQGSGAAGGDGTSAQGGAGGAGSTSGGGGGGGGLHSGGGGGAGTTGGAGGGGAALAGGGTSIAGSGPLPGGADDPDWRPGTAEGGAAGADGGPGRVVLAWTPGTAATADAAGLLTALLRDRAGFRHVRAGPDILVSLAADAASRTLVAGGGSFLALGIRKGDAVSLEGAAENTGTNFTVRDVSATILSTVEPLADMAPTTEFVLVAGDLDGPALVHLANGFPQPLGLWLGAESGDGRELVDRALAGFGGWIAVTPEGLVTFGRYEGPGTPEHRLTARDLLTLPRRVAAGPALWRRRIGARRCWRPHGAGEIAAAAPEPVRRFLAEEWREGVAEDAGHRLADAGAEEAFLPSLLDRPEDAATEATRQLALMSPDPLAFEVDATLRALPWRLGATVLLDTPEAGLQAPRPMAILARRVRLAEDRVTLTLLG